MSLKASKTSLDPHQRNLFIKRLLSSSAIGYIAARIVTSINPMHAILFNGAAEIINYLSSSLFKKFTFFNSPKLNRFKPFFKTVVLFTSAFLITNLFVNFSIQAAAIITAITVISQIAFAILGLRSLLGSLAKYTLNTLYNLKPIKNKV
ncbi:MAG: hypothetical protein KR126chlam6_01358 [Candidatus Anoxychlamydiales bacterium]|nr:hypothetical protein [Candidatus Anoxychlamydiales bacterium]